MKLSQTQTILPVHIAGAELHLYSLSNGMGIYLDLVKCPAFVYHVPKTVLACSWTLMTEAMCSKTLKRFIQSNSFYSLEDYFDFNWK
jgi:hypothetical protein